MSSQKQVSKQITEEGLRKDLLYLQRGIDCHAVLSTVCPPEKGLKVLEPGCGSGKLGLWYWLRGCDVTLIDVDYQALLYAEKLLKMTSESARFYAGTGTFVDVPRGTGQATIQPGSVLNLAWADGTYDFVFNEGVPHHWGLNPKDTRRQRAINEMVRVTRPGGWVCVIGSNALCPDTVRMAEEVEHTYPGMPPKQKPFTEEELKMRLERAGLEFGYTAPVSEMARLAIKKMVGRNRTPLDYSLRAVQITYSDEEWATSPLITGWGRKP